jgi:hypothetical protein
MIVGLTIAKPSRATPKAGHSVTAMQDNVVTVYRSGITYTSQPVGDNPRPTTLVLHDGARLRDSPSGEVLVARRPWDYGAPISEAVELGWCRVLK